MFFHRILNLLTPSGVIIVGAGHIIYRNSVSKCPNVENNSDPPEVIEALNLANQFFEEQQEAELDGSNSTPCKHEYNSNPFVESIRFL